LRLHSLPSCAACPDRAAPGCGPLRWAAAARSGRRQHHGQGV